MEAILRIEEKTWRIRLADNETAREFLSRLPFQAEFDVMEHERYCYFEEPFPRNPHSSWIIASSFSTTLSTRRIHILALAGSKTPMGLSKRF